MPFADNIEYIGRPRLCQQRAANSARCHWDRMAMVLSTAYRFVMDITVDKVKYSWTEVDTTVYTTKYSQTGILTIVKLTKQNNTTHRDEINDQSLGPHSR
ncbi:hypothetical protein Btru_046692, partial [Bulinus truncatus]